MTSKPAESGKVEKALAMSDRRRFTLALLISGALIGLSAWSCLRTGPESLRDVHVGAAVSDDECLQVARSFETAMNARDLNAVTDLMDWTILVEEALASTGITGEEQQADKKICMEAPWRRRVLTRGFTDAIGEKGSCKFLRIRADRSRKRLLFRLIHENGAYNYHELLLARRPGGHVRIVDVYMYSQGERIAESMCRMILLFTERTPSRGPAKATGLGSNFVGDLPAFRDMLKAHSSGKFQETLDLFHQLPPQLQQNKTLLFVRVQAAQGVSDAEYLAAVQAIRTHYPDDPCTVMMSVDYFLLKKEFGRALTALDQLENVVGGDPYLRVIRSGIHMEAGEFAEARQFLNMAIEEEPDLESAYWMYVNLALKEKQFGEVVKQLNIIEKKFGDDFDDFTQIPDYAEFVKSPQYQQWLKSREKK